MICVDCGVDVAGRSTCLNCGAEQQASLVASDAINPMFQPPAAPPPPRADDWICPRCSETIEGQFTECWKCAADGVEAPKAPPGAPRLAVSNAEGLALSGVEGNKADVADKPRSLEALIGDAFSCPCGSSVCTVEGGFHRVDVACRACGLVRTFKSHILRERIDGLSPSAAVALLRTIFS